MNQYRFIEIGFYYIICVVALGSEELGMRNEELGVDFIYHIWYN